MTVLLLAALALVLPGARGTAPQPDGVAAHAAKVVVRRIHHQRAVIAIPPRRTDRVVIVAHGAGHDAVSMMRDIAPLADALLDHGYTVVTNDAHRDNWGNRASRGDYVATAEAMRRRGLTNVFVLARSMGGLASLGAIRRIRPLAWAGVSPACNLSSLPRFRGRISHAWAMPWRRVLEIPQLNPVTPRGVRGMPMIFWASPEDTVVSKRLNTDLCARSARRSGARVTVVTTRGEHGDSSNLQPRRLLAFFDAAAAPRPSSSNTASPAS